MHGSNIKKWLKKNDTRIVDMLSLLLPLLIAGVFTFLYHTSSIDIATFISCLAAIIPSLILLFIYQLKKRDQTVLINFTYKYLIEGSDAKIDELLGILIAGKWRRFEIDPVDEFFEYMKQICKSENVVFIEVNCSFRNYQ